MKNAKYPKGQPADPTENMSPEDAAKWKAMNEEYGDKMKTADTDVIRQVDQMVPVFIRYLNEYLVKHKESLKISTPPVVVAEKGVRYYRIVVGEGLHRSAFGFIDRETGNLLKAASWKAPAKGARGNILDRNTWGKAHGPYGMTYLRAAYIVAEGCPDNLDESECREWESNTDKYKDKFKTSAKASPTQALKKALINYSVDFSRHLQSIFPGMKVTTTQEKPKYAGFLRLAWDVVKDRAFQYGVRLEVRENGEDFDHVWTWIDRTVQPPVFRDVEEKTVRFDKAMKGLYEPPQINRLMAEKSRNAGRQAAGTTFRPGDSAFWNGKKVSIVDTHGYPVKTVDLRWTISGTPGSKDEVSGHKRGVPVAQITKKASVAQTFLSDEFDLVEASLKTASVASIIEEQLGGWGRLRMMLGAYYRQYLNNGYEFGWPNKQSSKGNHVRITLRPDDTYDMEFFKTTWGVIGSTRIPNASKTVKKYPMLYAEQLGEVFYRQTGWALRLASATETLDDLEASFDKYTAIGDDFLALEEMACEDAPEGMDTDPEEDLMAMFDDAVMARYASAKVSAREPSPNGSNWKLVDNRGPKRWLWDDGVGNLFFTVREVELPLGVRYSLSMLDRSGLLGGQGAFRFKSYKEDPRELFVRARLMYKALQDLQSGAGGTDLTREWTAISWEKMAAKKSVDDVVTDDGSQIPDGSGNTAKRSCACDSGIEARYEEGKPADPTENMTPEDAAEWKRNTEEHKDKFKTAGFASQKAPQTKKLPSGWELKWDPKRPDKMDVNDESPEGSGWSDNAVLQKGKVVYDSPERVPKAVQDQVAAFFRKVRRKSAGQKPSPATKAQAKKLFDKWRADAQGGEMDDLDEAWQNFLDGDLTLQDLRENPPGKTAELKFASNPNWQTRQLGLYVGVSAGDFKLKGKTLTFSGEAGFQGTEYGSGNALLHMDALIVPYKAIWNSDVKGARSEWVVTSKHYLFSTAIREVLDQRSTRESLKYEIEEIMHKTASTLAKAPGKKAAGGDPYWMVAKYPGQAQDGTPVRKGDKVLYYPRTKTMMVGRAAEQAWRKFESEVADEDFYNRSAAVSPLRRASVQDWLALED
jgi:hypothetical protein